MCVVVWSCSSVVSEGYICIFHLFWFFLSQQANEEQSSTELRYYFQATQAIYDWTMETNNSDGNKQHSTHKIRLLLQSKKPQVIHRSRLIKESFHMNDWLRACLATVRTDMQRWLFFFFWDLCMCVRSGCRAEVLWSGSQPLQCSFRHSHWKVLLV